MTVSVSANPPLIWVIVLNFNGREHLGYCLPSIHESAYQNMQLLVVDNASPDQSAGLVHELCPDAKLILCPRNLGWAGGNNVGIKVALGAGARYVVLANNDIRVDPRWLEVAVNLAERDERIGIIGFDVHEPEPGSADRDAGFSAAQASWSGVSVVHPHYVGGMAMFVRAEVFDQIGLIDEAFFAYGEENDFQIRARKAGYDVVAVNIPVWHYGQGAFGKVPTWAAALQVRNNIRLLIKHGSLRTLAVAGVKHVFRRTMLHGKGGPNTPVERRLRAASTGQSMLLLLWGVAWNLFFLPATLWRRREDDRRAARARQARLHRVNCASLTAR